MTLGKIEEIIRIKFNQLLPGLYSISAIISLLNTHSTLYRNDLISITGNNFSPTFYVIGCAAITVVVLFFLRDPYKESLK
ncbi:hypothetical protein D0469_10125 [Peribacillus saganii]|uniref:Uncharacterized protein n=1 Tax=Peribacillus saganii TaxID=2303992 RepID=A0A372LP41_9BACI|nr:hypothetical protein D0469_10125 [Peribacillus saganii]